MAMMGWCRPVPLAFLALLVGFFVGRYVFPSFLNPPSKLEDKYRLATNILRSCDELERHMMLLELQRSHEILKQREHRVDAKPAPDSEAADARKKMLAAAEAMEKRNQAKARSKREPVAPPIEAEPIGEPQKTAKDIELEKTRAAAERKRLLVEEGERHRKWQQERSAEARKQEQLRTALQSEKFRPWIVLGGNPRISDAKIVAYHNGEVTLEKRDGEQKKIRASRLGKADREYLSNWVKEAGL